jgi:hypothetical protein
MHVKQGPRGRGGIEIQTKRDGQRATGLTGGNFSPKLS